MAFESSQSKGMRRPKKIGSASATAEHGGYLEGFLAVPKGQTTSFALTINHRRGLREGLETLTSSTSANKHCRSLREGLETVTSSALTNNYCCNLREGLKTQLVSTTSTLFVSDSNIPENTPSSIGLAETGYALWRGHRQRFGIKDLTQAARSPCEYIWEVILCIVLTNNGRLDPDIWPETPNQAESIEEMMRTIWAEEVHCR